MMTGFVYRWVNQVNHRWYIGSHKGTTDDGYRHSSKYLAMAEKKYGFENFTREILFEGDYEKDQIRSVREAEYLRKEDAANNPMSYNRSNITGPDCIDKEARQKISQKRKCHPGPNKGKKLSLEHRKNLSKSKKGHSWNKGIPKPDEFKEWLSESRKGKGNPMFGRTQSEEAIRKLQKSKGPQQIITCHHCGESGGISLMKRWHFDNCRQK